MNDLPTQPTRSLSDRLFHFRRDIASIDPNLARIFIPWALRHPRHFPAFFRLIRAHLEARRLRSTAGVRVPPFLVLSVTSRCNLHCAGCFAAAVGTVAATPAPPTLDLSEWRHIVDQAIALGVIGFVIAGGEPFLLRGITSLFRDYPDRLFLVFTNGTSLRDSDYQILRRSPNTVVIVSIEGDRHLTNLRRGPGVFEKAIASLDRLRHAGVLTGIAVTIGEANIDYWSNPRNMEALLGHSGPLAFFIEQIPVGSCDTAGLPAHPLLTTGQRARFRSVVEDLRSTGAAWIIHSPEDEEFLGGCVSAGRGFAHVTPQGDVTACPVSALATHNLRAATLRESLASPLFAMIRGRHHLLETEGHPCALFAHADELEQMAEPLGAYRTGAAAVPALTHVL